VREYLLISNLLAARSVSHSDVIVIPYIPAIHTPRRQMAPRNRPLKASHEWRFCLQKKS